METLGQLGFEQLELMASKPHLDLADPGWCDAVRRAQDETGTQVMSVNPPGMDLNLASPDPEVRAWSQEHYCRVADLAASIGAAYLVVVPGTRHPLLPCPEDDALDWVAEGVETIARATSAVGVRLLLETTPSRILDRGSELAAFIDRLGLNDEVGICYDVANAFMVEDPAAELPKLGSRVDLIHLSDTTRSRWGHSAIGSGEVDWEAIVESLLALDHGPAVMLETIHPSHQTEGLITDRRRLVEAGWGVS
jgi:sugar phosphate isomerase/epimerase